MLKSAASAVAVFGGSVLLNYRGYSVALPATGALTLGRSPACDLVIASQLASRNHATVTRGEGVALLSDQSINGTFVRFDSGIKLHLKRQSAPLQGSGMLSLGGEDLFTGEHLVQFILG